jgi:peroxiredoxin
LNVRARFSGSKVVFSMKTILLACVATLAGPLFFTALRAETATPAVAAPTNDEAIKKELEAVTDRVMARLEKGQNTEAELADELKAFDELSAKYAEDKSEAAAMIPIMKAMLYVQVFENYEAGIAILEKAAANFGGTPSAARIAEMIERLKKIAAAEAVTAVGKEFAPFKETATDGTVVDLSAYRGKVVLVDFWATWCGPCVAELPHVKEAYSKYHAQGFEVIGISLDSQAEQLAAFTKERQMPWPQLFDGKGFEGKVPQAYGIWRLPSTFLLNRDGKIAAKGLRGDALAKKVAELLEKKP